MTTCHIEKLPTEILLQIFSEVLDLNAPPPSTINFSLAPSALLTRSNGCKPLKSLSLVSWRWREVVLPELFKHSCVHLSDESRWARLCVKLGTHLKNAQQRTPDTRRLIRQIDDLSKVLETTCSSHTLGFSYVNGDVNDIPAEYLHWIPSLEGEVENFLRFLQQRKLVAKVKSVVLYAHQQPMRNPKSYETSAEVRRLWRTVFNALAFDEIVVAAPPSILATLSGAAQRDSEWDSWLFKMPYHYLRLAKNVPTSKGNSPDLQLSPDVRAREVFLYNIVPWTDMSYNEGTHLRGYGHYEYQWMKAPDVFTSLVEWLVKEKAHPRTPKIETVNFISAFPYATHVFHLTDALGKLDHLRRLCVKLADPDLLSNSELMGKAQPSDVYSEWEECYHHIARNFLAKAKEGTEFCASDTTNASLREQVQTCVERRSLMPPNCILAREEKDGVTTWTTR